MWLASTKAIKLAKSQILDPTGLIQEVTGKDRERVLL